MYDEKYNHFITEFTKELSIAYHNILAQRKEFHDAQDTSPLINLTLSVYMSSLFNILDVIKETTIGEIKLIHRMAELKSTLEKALMSLPWMYKIEERYE
jgi:hypothetical protein